MNNDTIALRTRIAAIVEEMAGCQVGHAELDGTLQGQFAAIAQELYAEPVSVGQFAKDCDINLSVAGLDKATEDGLRIIRFQRAQRDSIRRGLKAANRLSEDKTKGRKAGGKTNVTGKKTGKAAGENAADAATESKAGNKFEAVASILRSMTRTELTRTANLLATLLAEAPKEATEAPKHRKVAEA